MHYWEMLKLKIQGCWKSSVVVVLWSYPRKFAYNLGQEKSQGEGRGNFLRPVHREGRKGKQAKNFRP